MYIFDISIGTYNFLTIWRGTIYVESNAFKKVSYIEFWFKSVMNIPVKFWTNKQLTYFEVFLLNNSLKTREEKKT